MHSMRQLFVEILPSYVAAVQAKFSPRAVDQSMAKSHCGGKLGTGVEHDPSLVRLEFCIHH